MLQAIGESLEEKKEAVKSNKAIRDGVLVLLQWLFEKPLLYGIPARIESCGLGKTVYDPEFSAGPLRSFQALVASTQVANVNSRQALYNSKVEDWKYTLSGLSYVEDFLDSNCLIRFPILLPNEEMRDNVLRKTLKAGLGTSRFYPATLSSYGKILASVQNIDPTKKMLENAQSISKRIITLPTHSYVNNKDREKTKAILKEV